MWGGAEVGQNGAEVGRAALFLHLRLAAAARGWKNCSVSASATRCCPMLALLFHRMCVICGSRFICHLVHVVMVVDLRIVSLFWIFPGVVLFFSFVTFILCLYLVVACEQDVCSISTVIPVSEAVVAWCALPALSYLCEVAEDASVLAGVELELPWDGSGPVPYYTILLF